VLVASAAALPFFQLGPIAGFQPYGVLLIGGILAGCFVMAFAARHRGVPVEDAVLLAVTLSVAGFAAAHVFDVAANQLDRAADDPGLWFRLYDGVSLFGALLLISIVVPAWCRARRLDLPRVADAVALGGLVALAIGRLACTVVHDHLGTPTDLPIGFDVPPERARWVDVYNNFDVNRPIRLHDLGFEELVLVCALLASVALFARRLRPGMLAGLAALVYAPARFGLDILRPETTDVRLAGLTAAQWGCLAMLAIAMYAVLRTARAPSQS
jgi:phosphatidylglycerol:prolipoprotein diacylglycerol transferase